MNLILAILEVVFPKKRAAALQIAQDIAALQGIGGLQQQQRQKQLDAQRAGLLQAQQAPMAQYQALMPFMQMVPRGQTQVNTLYTPKPSAMQAALGTGLSTLGAAGAWNQQEN